MSNFPSVHPFIEADGCIDLAQKYAQLFTEKIRKINEDYPKAKMSSTEEARFDKKFENKFEAIALKNFELYFVIGFCYDLASRAIISPSETE